MIASSGSPVGRPVSGGLTVPDRARVRLAVPPHGFAILSLITMAGSLIASPARGQCVDYSAYLRIVGSLDTPGISSGLAVAGTRAFIADDSNGLVLVDLSTPRQPVIESTVDTPGRAVGVVVSGSQAYVADGYAGLQIIDFSNPQAPIIGSMPTGGSATSVSSSGLLVSVSEGEAGLQLLLPQCDPTSGIGERERTKPALALRTLPNPGAGRREIRLWSRSGGPLLADLFDSAGRRVRGMHRGLVSPGEQNLRWDGRDEGGRPVPAGVYLLRVALPEAVGTERVVVIR